MNTSTQTGIYNMALAAIGVNRFVQSPTDGSKESRTCNVFWDAVRDQVLQDFAWGFAMRYNALQLISKTLPNWFFCYKYPADCVQARLVLPTVDLSNDVTLLNVPGYQSYFGDFWALWCNPSRRIPFAVVEDEAGGGLAIATNLETPTLVYTARIKTITLWSPAFVNALVLLLGSKVIAPLSADPEYVEKIGLAYEAAILKAGALSMNEGAEKPEPESEFIRIRE
jgi:hypothetical protein